MASLEAVTEALTRMDLSGLAGQSRNLTDSERQLRVQVYLEALDGLSDADVKAAASLAVKRDGAWYPTPGQLIALVRPAVSIEAAVSREAHAAYTRIVSAYEGGLHYDYRNVLEELGESAGQAFLAAGGSGAFEWCEPGTDEAFRLKRFVEAYREQIEAQHAERAALHAGAAPALRLTRPESAAALKGLLEKLPSISVGEVS